MDGPGIDLDAYFRRIGYEGSTEPGLATLAALQSCHAGRIPFENLDVLLGRPIRLDPESLQRKVVHEGRGGYCFEHNTLFQHVLRSLDSAPDGASR
jgi:N-hydroxyarylamine O-acetyltransferase